MTNTNRLMILTATAAFFGFVAGAGPVSAQTKEARGTVAALTTISMTVKVGAKDMTFFVDGNTHLEVRRAARQIQALLPATPRVNDFFEVGNPVLVRYEEGGGVYRSQSRFHALNIERVGSAGSAHAPRVAEGMVTSVSASHMTVASDGHDITFAITGDTDVMAKGASKAKKAAGRGTPLTTFVRAGDTVSVSYKKAAGAITASEIRVRTINRN